jgi:sugar lactone lactonase YvrE
MTRAALLALTLAAVAATAAALHGQAPAPPRTGPGVQAAQDAREPEVLAKCKTPPPAQQGRGGPGPQGRGAPTAANAGPREYSVKEIPGVVAAGAQWKVLWEEPGNNADGLAATRDGGILIAQNDKSLVIKLDKSGKASVVYADTNTGGALSFNAKGELFIAERALNPAIWRLEPKRTMFANMYQGDPLDCLGGVLNDLAADRKGGVYFTMAGLLYANPAGVITKYGENLRTNGIVLSPDEKTLYTTNQGSLAAFDVQPDGSLTNQREFVKLEGGGGDGSTVDRAGRIYVTGGAGINVIGPDGRYLGAIPTPRNVISVAFSGADRSTLYAVGVYNNDAGRNVQIIAIPTIAKGLLRFK